MSQTTHNILPALGTPGQLFDEDNYRNDIISCVAAEAIQPGRYVELAGTDVITGVPVVQQCQGTVSTCSPLGVSIRDAQFESNTWPANASAGIPAGSRVSVLRRGRIFVERDPSSTTAVTRFGALAILHPSGTSTALRGCVTSAATTTSANAEVTAFTGHEVWQDTAISTLALMEVYVK